MINRKLFSAVVIFFLSCMLCSCATAPSVKEQHDEPVISEALKEEKTEGEKSDLVNSVDIINTSKGCRVRISASRQPAYTVFKLGGPERIVVDISGMAQGAYQSLINVQNDYIGVVKSSEVLHKGREYLRIEIGLQKDYPYNAFSMAEHLYIDIFKDPSQETVLMDSTDGAVNTSNAVAIVNLLTHSFDSGDRISVVSSSPVMDFSYFTLTEPNRIVVDFPDVDSELRMKKVDVGSSLVEKVRVGGDEDNVSFVVDLAGDDFPFYHVDQEADSINIVVSKKEAEQAEAVEKGQEKSDEKVDAADPHKYTGARISLDFKDADIKNVLRLISEISGLNMIIGDAVQGKVTLKLDNIPWDEAFDIVLETNNLGKIETPNVIHIETKTNIKRINEERILARRIEQDIEDLTIHSVDISYAKAADVVKFIRDLKVLSNRGSITSFSHNNRVTIQEVPSNMLNVLSLVQKQDMPTRQVLIEAKVIQSNPNYTKELGIRWGGTYRTTMDGGVAQDGADIELSGPQSNNWAVNLPAAIGEGVGGGLAFGYIKDTYRLNLQLSALEKDDKVKIISHPKILGLNNKEARIKQGVALPYLKLSDQGVTSTEFKDAVLELRVTPTITPANTVSLNVFVTKNQRSAQTGAGNEPGIDVREVETELLVENGRTIVIGGIYETTETANVSKVPVLGDIPFMGRLFKSESTKEEIQEMLVFLTVTIVEEEDQKMSQL